MTEITDIAWEKISPSKDGIAKYRATAKYKGHSMIHVLWSTDEHAADREAMTTFIRYMSQDFVLENPPA